MFLFDYIIKIKEDVLNLCKKLAPKDASASSDSSGAIYLAGISHILS